jgi:hypothetical protein
MDAGNIGEADVCVRVRTNLATAQVAYSDEAGHRFRFEAGQSFRFHSGQHSDLKPAIFRH